MILRLSLAQKHATCCRRYLPKMPVETTFLKVPRAKVLFFEKDKLNKLPV
jgi:hypothetical protein